MAAAVTSIYWFDMFWGVVIASGFLGAVNIGLLGCRCWLKARGLFNGILGFVGWVLFCFNMGAVTTFKKNEIK